MIRRWRLAQLAPLNTCMARVPSGGEWRLLLWSGGVSWWAR